MAESAHESSSLLRAQWTLRAVQVELSDFGRVERSGWAREVKAS